MQDEMMERTPEKMLSLLDGAYSMTKFDGEDDTYSSVKWAEDIEDNAEIFAWSPQQKLIIARRSLTKTAALWLKTEKVFKTFEELKTAMLKEFPEHVNTKEMHELMAARKKKTDESFHQYMLVMKEMGKRGKFPDYVAIEYIVEGIKDREVNKAVLYGATTYPVLKERLKIYEKMKEREKTAAKQYSEQTRGQGVATQSAPDRRRCYNCGENSHIASACPNGIKCFRCNEFGHMGMHCRATTTMTPARRDGGAGIATGTGATGISTAGRLVKQAQYGASTAGGSANMTYVPGMSAKQFGQSNTNQRGAMFGTAIPTGTSTNEDEYNCQVQNSTDSDVYHIVNKDENKRKITKKAMKMVKVCGFSVNTLVDSGSCANLLSDELFTTFGMDKNEDDLVISGLGHTRVRSSGQFRVSVIIDGQSYDDVIFHIVPKDCMLYSLILGQEFLSKLVVLMCDGEVRLLPREDEWLMRVNCCVTDVDVTGNIPCDRVPREVEDLVQNHTPYYMKEVPIELRIILKDDVPVRQRPRRLAFTEQKIVEEQVQELLEKQKLVTDPILKIHSPRLVTEQHTDASSQALAAILKQRHADGALYPVHYMSHKTSEKESCYSSYELKALAVIQGVKKLRQYHLYGIHFKIVTDCKVFEMTLKQKDVIPKVAKRALLLDEYDYEIEHRAGTEMRHAGAIAGIHDEIRYRQESEDELNAVRQIVLKEGVFNDYWIDSGIIHKGDQKEIVVPTCMEEENGHFSTKKMKEAVSKDYNIGNMDKKIGDDIRSGMPRLLATRKAGKAEGFLGLYKIRKVKRCERYSTMSKRSSTTRKGRIKRLPQLIT